MAGSSCYFWEFERNLLPTFFIRHPPYQRGKIHIMFGHDRKWPPCGHASLGNFWLWDFLVPNALCKTCDETEFLSRQVWVRFKSKSNLTHVTGVRLLSCATCVNVCYFHVFHVSSCAMEGRPVSCVVYYIIMYSAFRGQHPDCGNHKKRHFVEDFISILTYPSAAQRISTGHISSLYIIQCPTLMVF